MGTRTRAIETVISASGAGKSFGSVDAVEEIDLNISRGEIVSVVGPSGSGKTTTIRLLLGLYKPSRGQVDVFGMPPEDFTREESERIGYLPQQFLLYNDLTVRENLLFAAGMYGLGPRERRDRIPKLLEQLDLTAAADRLARDISGGMQRRVALAATLIHQPDLIVLDEPTAGLDPVLRESIWQMFEELRQAGATLLITTQYITETERGDRILLISDGSIVASGTPDGLRQQVFGGEVVRLTTSETHPEMIEVINGLDFVADVRQIEPGELEIVVDSADTAIPRLLEAFGGRDFQIDQIREVQLSLDSVFVELVQRSSEPA